MDAYFPFRYFMGESIQNEIIPFWNPYIYLGYPFYSDPQSAFWYPISWMLSLNGYSIFDLHFEFIIYFIFGGIGFYRLLKYFQITSWVALIFGISYQLSGFFIGSASLLTFLIGASFLPWSILYFYKLLSKITINAIIGFVISISLILTGGYPAILIILIYILIFIFLFEIINQKDWTFQKFIPWLFNLAFSSILILILNAGYLYSIYQSSSWITRGQGISIESAMYGPFPRKALISLIAPFASAFQNDILASDIAMTNVFVGTLALIFFPLGLFSKNKKVFFWIFIAFICLLASFGESLPIRTWLYNHVPFMNLFRFPSIFRLFFIFGFLISSAYGMNFYFKHSEINNLLKKIKDYIVYFLAIIIMIVIGFSMFKNQLNFDFYKDLLFFHNRLFAQSIVQLIIIIIIFFVFKKFKSKKLKGTLIFIVCIEFFISTQLCIRGTAISSKRVDKYLETLQKCPKGFPNPKLTPINKLKVFDTTFAPSWYNQSIFYKSITDQGYNPFQLNEFQKFEKDSNKKVYLHRAFLHFNKKENLIHINYFQPNRFLALFKTKQIDTLTILQIYNPLWNVISNKKSLDIIKNKNGLMQVVVPKGVGKIEIIYRPFFTKVLLMISIFGYGIILLFMLIKFVYYLTITSNLYQRERQNYP